jgi:hypothetical protein
MRDSSKGVILGEIIKDKLNLGRNELLLLKETFSSNKSDIILENEIKIGNVINGRNYYGCIPGFTYHLYVNKNI